MEKLIKEMKEKNLTAVDVPGCIIDAPQDKMSIPLVDVDVEEQVDILIGLSKLAPSPTWKKVFSMVRGMGGGKTRELEEMRRILLLREGVFVLSTFILCVEL